MYFNIMLFTLLFYWHTINCMQKSQTDLYNQYEYEISQLKKEFIESKKEYKNFLNSSDILAIIKSIETAKKSKSNNQLVFQLKLLEKKLSDQIQHTKDEALEHIFRILRAYNHLSYLDQDDRQFLCEENILR